MRRSSIIGLITIAACATSGSLAAQAPSTVIDPRLYAGLEWRNVGPFRGGRVGAVTGVIGEVGTFYAGFPGGGVWKTTSAGQVWYPVFDAIKEVSSVGAVEVAPSDPNIVYVGTGDMITGGTLDQGNGVYKSSDAGKSWQHLGLAETRHIQTMLVDPHDPNIVMIGSLGDPLTLNGARGVFRSSDGGRTWNQTLFVDSATGINKLARAFDVPNVIFATSMRHYAPPNYSEDRLRSPQFSLAPRPDSARTGTAIYKSTDNGVTWHELATSGLPRLTGRTSIAVAMGTKAQRLYFITNSGLYRSDDGGATWHQLAADDSRIRNGQGGYNCGVYVDPQNPDIVYTVNTSSYRSTDGGRTFTGFKGAPGGDDPQQFWIDPTNGQRMLFGYDQGLVVTLDGGTTWSSWYNQSTEQVYHVAADNSFPYWVYATQQDAGAIRTRSRGNYGAITMFDWNSVNGWEWGTMLPDPLNPNIVYASGGGIVKIFYPSEQWINVSPAVDPAARARSTSSAPIIFAPWNQHQLIAGMNYVASTTDGGAHWTRISPELGIPEGLDSAAAANVTNGRGAIESMSASTVTPGIIWVGTSNGLIHVTRDFGKSWSDVTIPGLPNPRRANVSAIDASHHAAGTAYVAIEYLRGGDYTPYLFRTRDFGGTWTRITVGLPTDEPSGSFSGSSARTRRRRPALRRLGERRVRLLRRRRSLAITAAEPAQHPGPRPADQGQRPDRRNPRPRHLDHGRHQHASATHAGDGRRGRAPVCTGDHRSGPPQCERRYAPSAGNASRAQPARRGDHRLLAFGEAGDRRQARYPRCRRRDGPALLECAIATRGRSGAPTEPELLAGHSHAAPDDGWHESGQLGPAAGSTAGVLPQLRHQCQSRAHAAVARRGPGAPGRVHHHLVGGRKDEHPAGHGDERPALAGVAGGADGAGLPAQHHHRRAVGILERQPGSGRGSHCRRRGRRRQRSGRSCGGGEGPRGRDRLGDWWQRGAGRTGRGWRSAHLPRHQWDPGQSARSPGQRRHGADACDARRAERGLHGFGSSAVAVAARDHDATSCLQRRAGSQRVGGDQVTFGRTSAHC